MHNSYELWPCSSPRILKQGPGCHVLRHCLCPELTLPNNASTPHATQNDFMLRLLLCSPYFYTYASHFFFLTVSLLFYKLSRFLKHYSVFYLYKYEYVAIKFYTKIYLHNNTNLLFI